MDFDSANRAFQSLGSGKASLETKPSLRKLSSSLSVNPSSNGLRVQAQQDAYLSELLGFSLERLRKEPDILADEQRQVERSLQSTCLAHYPAFIQAAGCLNTISSELGSVCVHLDKLLQGIPELASSCEAFGAQANEVLQAYSHNKQLASHQSELQELLELPQLMDTCVRNGVYDEALDLQAFVSRMALLHPHLPLVKLLMSQVQGVAQAMIQQLLSRLRQGCQLPECLRVMGYLRRMAAFTEPQLRTHFLQCRDEWMSGLIDELDDKDAYEYIKQLTDIHRLHLFDSVMQYKAVFFDSSSGSMGGAAASVVTGFGSFTAPGAPATQDAAMLSNMIKESGLLTSWVQHRLSQYMDTLSAHLPRVSQGSNLAALLEHCMYCGSSLARVGLDFQGLLLPLFQAATNTLLAGHLAAAVDAFSARLESHKWVSLTAPALKKQQSDKATRPSIDGGSSNNGDVAAEDMSPPYSLMEHLPLAIFANGVLTALNELRQCALQSCSKTAAGLLQQACEQMAGALSHYHSSQNLADQEASLFRGTVKAALDTLLPYLASCFAKIFQGTGQKLDTSAAATALRTILAEA